MYMHSQFAFCSLHFISTFPNKSTLQILKNMDKGDISTIGINQEADESCAPMPDMSQLILTTMLTTMKEQRARTGPQLDNFEDSINEQISNSIKRFYAQSFDPHQGGYNAEYESQEDDLYAQPIISNGSPKKKKPRNHQANQPHTSANSGQENVPDEAWKEYANTVDKDGKTGVHVVSFALQLIGLVFFRPKGSRMHPV